MKSKLLQNTKAGIYLRLSNDNDKGIIHLPRQHFPELKRICKMGVSRAKEVKFTTFAGRENLKGLKLIDGVLANISVGMPFLF